MFEFGVLKKKNNNAHIDAIGFVFGMYRNAYWNEWEYTTPDDKYKRPLVKTSYNDICPYKHSYVHDVFIVYTNGRS